MLIAFSRELKNSIVINIDLNLITICIPLYFVYGCMYICMYELMFVFVCLYPYVCIQSVCVYVCSYMCSCVCIHRTH